MKIKRSIVVTIFLIQVPLGHVDKALALRVPVVRVTEIKSISFDHIWSKSTLISVLGFANLSS